MNTIVDNKTGILILIPENAEDKNLIFHLLNCSQLTEFTDYLSNTEYCKPITEDLGVTVDQFDAYPVSMMTDSPDTGMTGSLDTGMPLHLRSGFREITVRPIGFNRDSS